MTERNEHGLARYEQRVISVANPAHYTQRNWSTVEDALYWGEMSLRQAERGEYRLEIHDSIEHKLVFSLTEDDMSDRYEVIVSDPQTNDLITAQSRNSLYKAVHALRVLRESYPPSRYGLSIYDVVLDKVIYPIAQEV